MNKEKIRNTSLGLLIILSFLLSVNLWTTGGSIEEDGSSELQTSESTISIVDHAEVDAFRPTAVALHGVGEQSSILLGNTYSLKNFLSKQMQRTNLYQIEYSESASYEDYLEELDSGEWLEFIFNEEQPIGLLSNKFAEISQDMANNLFDRIVINIRNKNALYFYHTNTQSVYTASMIEGESLDVTPFLNLENLEYIPAEATILANNIIYLPIEAVEIPYKSYVIDKLPTSTYISNFFPDTSQVDVRSAETFTRYIDLAKEVTVNDKNDTLVYLKQVYGTEELEPVDRYRKSFEQIDRFENWADTFILSNYDKDTQIISFRREIEGIPVFSTSNHESVSEVGLVENEVTHLKLPLRFTSTPITIDDSPKKLIAGEELIQEIKKVTGSEDLKKVEDVMIGYTWQDSEEEKEVALFNPDWYILYDGKWQDFNTFLKSHEEAAYGF